MREERGVCCEERSARLGESDEKFLLPHKPIKSTNDHVGLESLLRPRVAEPKNSNTTSPMKPTHASAMAEKWLGPTSNLRRGWYGEVRKKSEKHGSCG